ncbi:MAG: methyltransferase domain-containing protein [Thermodesulfovibrionia bacterium]|nr:methyltransferase domain-containing protein [Thermodesulfovibrionia bacterium]
MAGILDQTKEIRKIWSGYQSSRVLITANNFRIFDYLEEQKTAKYVADKLKTDRRATEILLDALTGLGLLRKNRGGYKNAGIASRLLVSGRPYYQGDIIKHVNSLWDNWSDLDRILKTGVPSRKSRDHKAFILGMHNLASLKAKEIIKEIGLKGVKKALDLGGGPGTYTIEMAKKGIHVTLFDTAETVKIARTVVNQFQKDSKNITFVQGDFLVDDIGSGYDLIFMSQIIHSFSEKNNIMLLRKCRKALNSNGRVVIQEFFINENRTQPPHSAMFAVNMLVNTQEGRTYSPDEIKDWFLKEGFKKISKKLVADGVLVSARK